MKLTLPILAATALWVAVGPLWAGPLPGPAAPFLEQHCFECHDAEANKGKLNLADFRFDPADGENFKVWQRVFERVRDGEMPPEKKPRPGQEEAETFLGGLGTSLMEADLSDIAARGRVRNRRLTRTEYEHTLHDLLGIDIPLRELLPEDPVSHGFETVADGQQLSHHHLARYLDVADLALEEAFQRALKGDVAYKKKYTPEQLAARTPGNYRGPDLRDGTSISWPISLQFFGRMPVTEVPADGWYRITLRGVRAINPGGNEAVWGTLRSGACSSDAPILYMIGMVEATAKPRDLVFEAWIREDHGLELKPNDGELRRAPTGATGGNVSFKKRNLEKEGFSGIAHRGIEVERIYPVADRKSVSGNLFGDKGLDAWKPDPAAGLDDLVKRFADRAFRRPATAAQLAPYREIGREALAEGESLSEALRSSYRAILCSPRFLTFTEAPGALDDYAVASRLSYALWVSMPDRELMKLANEGKLHQAEVLEGQIERMLDDPKSGRFIRSFTGQWLKLKEIDFTSPDQRLFPTFDAVVQESMVAETRAYVAELIENNLGVENFVDSSFAFLNGRLARHYHMDVPVKPGGGLQKIALPGTEKTVRGGLVTQGAVLKVTADGTSTSPVVRGVFVNERILGEHIPPPPPNIPAIEPDIRGATTVREQLDKHRSNTSCYSCHSTIDPPGFALENFDPVGGWRTRYGRKDEGKAVDPAGVTPEGQEFDDLIGWKEIYAKRGDQLARGFAKQFLTYATGAPVRFSDGETIEEIVAQSENSGYGVRSIIHAAVASPVFLKK